MNASKTFRNFCALTRAYSIPMSLTPLLVACACTFAAMPFLASGFLTSCILLFIAVSLLHLSGNLYDDYRDVKAQLEQGKTLCEINFKNKNKAALIINGTFSIKKVELILLSMLSIAFIIGLHFLFAKGLTILIFMVVGALLCHFYPVSSKYGLQELTIGALFGPILIGGSFVALTGFIRPEIIYISISSGLMTSILLIVHNLMDYEYDIENDKKTIPVLLKNKYLTINLLSVIIILAFIMFNKACPNGAIIPAVIITLPLAVNLICSLYDYVEVKDVQFKPKWYLGNMENWEEIEKSGMAYFMYRFYLARNLSVVFNVSMAIVILFALDVKPIYIFDFFYHNFWGI